MDAVEQIVEIYFQKCRACFTLPDVKVASGNNRQIDLLSYSAKEKNGYHIESSVTHRINWNPKIEWLKERIEYKFFGVPGKNGNKSGNTDRAKNKNYLEKIKETYETYGLKYEKINRVWVLWCIDKMDDEGLLEKNGKTYLKEKINGQTIEILSFRDDIIPQLEKIIGTANYEHEITRTISLIIQYQNQKRERRG
jgi:hypothetical protein